MKIILVNKEQVIFSNVVTNGTKLDGNMQLMIRSGHTIKDEYQSIIFNENKVEGIYNMLPIVTNEGIIGSLIVVNNEGNNFVICELLNKIVSLELNIA